MRHIYWPYKHERYLTSGARMPNTEKVLYFTGKQLPEIEKYYFNSNGHLIKMPRWWQLPRRIVLARQAYDLATILYLGLPDGNWLMNEYKAGTTTAAVKCIRSFYVSVLKIIDQRDFKNLSWAECDELTWHLREMVHFLHKLHPN